MRISILILNYNGKEMTARAIKSFLKSDLSSNDFEIIVVDNASTDGSVSYLKNAFPKVKIVENKKNSGLGGMNKGISYCRGDYVFFTNNDVFVEKDCLSKLYNLIKDKEKVAVVAPKYINHFSKKPEGHGTWVSRSFYSGYKKKKSSEMIIPYIGIGLIKKSVLSKLGYLFDNDYFLYAEDVDLGLRIRIMGLKIVYVPEAVMYHMHAATVEKVTTPSKVVFLMERNLLVTFYKICSLRSIFLLFPYVYIMRFAAFFRDLITLKFSNAFSRIKAIAWVFINMKLVIKKRRFVQAKRKVSDKFLFKVFSEKYILKR